MIKATRKHAEPLAGEIVYETLDGPQIIQYSERDIDGEYTLFSGTPHHYPLPITT